MNITKDMATESHQSVKHDAPVVAYCSACLTRYFVSFLTFQQTMGLCSCSWSCCKVAQPSNRSHQRHMAERPATAQDLEDAAAGTLKDLREPCGWT